MPDNKVDSILLEIEATTEKADGGIDKITKALTSMKKITEGLDTEKFKQIVDVMRGFSGIGDDLKNAGSGMRGIASSIKSLSGIDTAKLKEVTAAVKDVSAALGNLGSNNRVNIRVDSEGAQRRIQPLENGQQAVASAESVATASEQAQVAMNGAASSASQLAQEENRLGSAGQSAAAGENALNESLNRTNTNPANRKIQELINQINKYKATISGMESGKVMFDTSQYSEAVNGLRQAQEQFKQFKESVTEAPKTMEDVAKAISSIGNAAQKCGLGAFSSLLNNIAAILPSIETGGMAANAGFQSMAAGLQAVQTAIPIIGIILTVLTSIINVINQIANAVKNAVQKVIATTKTVVNKIRSGVSSIINKFKELKKSVRASLGFSEKQAGSFAKKLGSIVRLGTFMLLRSAFTHLFELIKTGFDNLVVYSKRVGTEFHKNVNLLYNDLRQLGASLATAFEPILNVVTPILDYLIQKLIAATNALAQFFSALTGKSFYTKAIKQNKDYTDSLNSAAKAAKNLTTGIDELNILSDDKGGSGKSDDVDGSGFETDEIAEKYKNLADMIKTARETGDSFAIGKMLGDKLAETLANIPWDEIKAQARKLGKSLATLINGIIQGEFDGKSVAWWIGHTLAEAINTAFEFIDETARELNWAGVGQAIVDTFQGIIDSLDWGVIYSALIATASGMAEMLSKIFGATATWEKAGKSIRKAVNALLLSTYIVTKNFPYEDFGRSIATFLGNALNVNLPVLIGALTQFINGAFGALLSFAEMFPFEELATSITTAISKLFGEGGIDWESIRTSVGTISAKLGGFLNDIFTNTNLEDVGKSFGELIYTLFTGIGDFLEKINFEEIGSNIAGAIRSAVDTIEWENVGGTINSLITGVCTLINTMIDEVDWYSLLNGVSDAMAEVDWDTLLATVFKVFAAKWTFEKMFKFVSWSTIWEELRTSVIEGISKKLGIGSDDGEINTIGEHIVSGLLKGISRACMPAPLQAALDCFGLITDIVKGIFGINSPSKVFAEMGGYLVDGFIDGISNKFEECKKKILEWAGKVRNWFSGSSEADDGVDKTTWQEYGQSVIDGFNNKISSSYTSTQEYIATWASGIKEWFTGASGGINSNTWSTYGENIISGFRTKILNAYTTTQSCITTWATSIKTWFTSICSYSSFYNIAADVVRGFNNGIGALYKTCKDNIDSWGSDIIKWFKKKLDSNSPSKVFIGIGEDTVKGFNIGIENEGTKTKSIMSSWADSFTDMDVNLGTRLRINDSALKDYQNNYGSDFTNEAIVQRVTKEVSTAGAIQTTLNSGGGLKTAIKEALDELGITVGVSEISQNTKTQADKKEQTIVEIGGRTVTETVVRQRSRNGFSFQPT